MNNCEIIIVTEDVVSQIVANEDVLSVIEVVGVGPRGDPGIAGGATFQLLAAENISGLKAIYATSTGARTADKSAFASSQVVGISKNSASVGSFVEVQPSGEMQDPSWNWTPGLPLYLSTFGNITHVLPTIGEHVEIGVAMTSQKIIIRIQPPITLN
jgi:hypothetical protein